MSEKKKKRRVGHIPQVELRGEDQTSCAAEPCPAWPLCDSEGRRRGLMLAIVAAVPPNTDEQIEKTLAEGSSNTRTVTVLSTGSESPLRCDVFSRSPPRLPSRRWNLLSSDIRGKERQREVSPWGSIEKAQVLLQLGLMQVMPEITTCLTVEDSVNLRWAKRPQVGRKTLIGKEECYYCQRENVQSGEPNGRRALFPIQK